MKRRIALALSAGALAVSALAAPAAAAQPADPGCFGRDRAAGVQMLGGSVWGQIAAERGATNGDHNRAYKVVCGG